jgi:hypothetical protein
MPLAKACLEVSKNLYGTWAGSLKADQNDERGGERLKDKVGRCVTRMKRFGCARSGMYAKVAQGCEEMTERLNLCMWKSRAR